MCQDSFDLLKKYLMASPIFKYPDPVKPSTLFTDASKYAWACVLTQAYDVMLGRWGIMHKHSSMV